MGPPGGARNAVDPRFISLFSVFEIATPSTENLRTIYQTILGRHLARMQDPVGSVAMGLLVLLTNGHGMLSSCIPA